VRFGADFAEFVVTNKSNPHKIIKIFKLYLFSINCIIISRVSFNSSQIGGRLSDANSMKKTNFSLGVIILFFTGFFFTTASTFVNLTLNTKGSNIYQTTSQFTPTPTPVVTPPISPSYEQLQLGEKISFFHLGVKEDTILNGPYDSFFMRFNTPANWQLKKDAAIKLKLGVKFTYLSETHNFSGAKLDIYFDNKLIDTLGLEAGENNEYYITIPLEKFVDDPTYLPLNQGEHSLYLFMDASIDCGDIYKDGEEFHGRVHTTVTVKTDSYFDLPHDLIPMDINLAALPLPIFQENGVLPSKVVLIVPDMLTKEEAQSALAVMTGFSKMTAGLLQLEMMPASKLTDEVTKQSNIILVGKVGSLPLLDFLKLPIPLTNKQFTIPYGQPDDGVLLYVPSPWNNANVILIVSGNSDAGVLKASIALSSGSVKGSEKPDTAVISNVQEQASNVIIPENRTLTDLGYPQNTKLTGIGHLSALYNFYLPPEYGTNTDAYFDLSFTHSAMFNLANSGLEVAINDYNFGSLAYSIKTTSTTIQRFSIPPYTVHPGINRLEVRVNHTINDACIPIDLENWSIIYNGQSILHLPLVPVTNPTFPLSDLKYYQYSFTSNPDLTNFAFILPKNDTGALIAASKVAFDLGSKSFENLALYKVYYDDDISEEVKKEKNLIIVGKPANMQIFSELGDKLPVPFKPGSNIAEESVLRIAYRLPEKIDVGYLEMMSSPWNDKRTILAVLGSSDLGLDWAVKALTKSGGKLTGNYATTNGKDVFSSDTRQGAGSQALSATAFPTQITPEPIDSSSFIGQTESNLELSPAITLDSKIWIPYIIVIVSVLIIAVLLVVFISAIRRSTKRTPK